jgi:FKBP-type peptidyl-prolyl cis-trans isomerase FkpA
MCNQFKKLICISIILFSLGCNVKPKETKQTDNKQFQENLIKANKGLILEDEERIRSYIKRHNWKMEKTLSGLWYMITEKGSGSKVKENDILTLKYRLELLDGTLCYSSDSLGLKTLKLGQGGIENGMVEGLIMLHQGDKANFIMPPYMAHGLLGDENKIPPRSVIVYEVELVKISEK